MARQRKRCKLKSCNKLFTPVRDFQKCCSYECDIVFISNKDNLKKLVHEGGKNREKEYRAKKKKLNNSNESILRERAQSAFNKFIRTRDALDSCISCDYKWGQNNYQRQAHASHYMSISKSRQLRFNESNVHKSCQQCNTHLSGNLVEYRIRLINKIGLEKVEELEKIANSSTPYKHTLEDYKNIEKKYKQKLKELK